MYLAEAVASVGAGLGSRIPERVAEQGVGH